MTKRFFLLSFITLITITSCNNASPEKSFDIAVLNTNMYMGFANSGLSRELDQPTVRMVGTDPNKTESMKRSEVIAEKIEFVETNLSKLKKINQTDDNGEMIKTSIDLQEYMLPVYRNEYMKLASLYDNGAPQEQIKLATTEIETKYSPGFISRLEKLMAIGKAFAKKHNIDVRWPE